MSLADKVLDIIRQHPDGISTSDIRQIIYPERRSEWTRNIYTRARLLEKYGLVTRSTRLCTDCVNHERLMTVWRPTR